MDVVQRPELVEEIAEGLNTFLRVRHMIPLPEYAKIKDKYCIAYFGNCDEYLVQLKFLRPIMEKTYPGIQVYLACKPSALEWLEGEENVVTGTINHREFGYFRELRCDMRSHPVEAFMKESNIHCGPVRAIPIASPTKRGVIIQNGMLPTRSMSMDQILACRKFLFSKSCTIEMDGDIENADIVVGVESPKLFQAGANGTQVALVPTGFGENLFKSMYPRGTVLNF